MSQIERNALIGAVFSLLLSAGASAQPLSVPQNFNVGTLSFDLWCQQTQHYSADRCKERRPADVKAFEDYRAVIERYEFDYLKRVQKDQDAKEFTNRDPIGTVRDHQDGIR